MFSSMKRFAFVGFGVLCSLSTAAAQYPYPSYPPVYAPYAGAGGYMAGQAQVISSVGDFQTQQQQAQLLNQKALQEQLKTKKADFDWQQYEAANTPSFGQQQAHIKAQKEFRILTNPTSGEILTGEALNTILPGLLNMANKGTYGPPIPIQPWVVSKINVTVPNSAGSAGMLLKGSKIDFPPVLQGPTQEKLAEEIPAAVSMAVNGKLNFKLYQEVRADMDQLRDEHKKKFHKDEIDAGSYLIGTRFLDDLDGSVKVLEQPNAAQLLNGSIVAKGSTVQELVQNMAKQGVTFAAATPGDENAYMSLFNSMATYGKMGLSMPTFQVQSPSYGPPYGSPAGPPSKGF